MILSAAPVILKYGYDNNISFKGGVVHTFDGLNYSDSPFLASATDVALNNEQLLVLTSSIKLSDCVLPVTVPAPESYIYSTLIQDYAGNYLYSTSNAITGSTIGLTTNINLATVFNFYFPLSAKTIQIFYTVPNNTSTKNIYLVCNNSLNSVSGCPIDNINDPSYYTYYYMLSGAAFSLITVAPGIQTQWLYNNSGTLQFHGLSADTPNNITVPANFIFYATRLNNNNINNQLQAYGQSDLIKYQNVNNELIVGNDTGNTKFNYLISSAFKTLSSDQTVNANANILKNYYSPMHNQSAVLSSSLRYYTKLYTGLNETTGFDKIYLGYNASTSNIIFTKDTSTYFHYPYGTNTLPLSSSTLIDYGARADITPYRSDKIFKKVADYKNYSNWGNSTNSSRSGMYFCSWLSAGNIGTGNGRPVWVDRYYNPRYVNVQSLTESAPNILTNSSNNYPNLIWDVPSTLTFDPGVLYYYDRVGDVDNNTIVESITGLTYNINSWNTNLINNVTGLTAGQIVNYTSANSVTDDNLRTPYYDVGTTYGFIDTKNTDFNSNQGNTLSFFAYQTDWTNVIGDQIVGNYFNGGIGVFNNNKILTPYFTVCSYTSNGSTVQTYNTELSLINTETFTTLSATSPALSSIWDTPAFTLKGTYDNNYYIVDNFPNKKYISTFDPGDLITNKSPLSSYITLSSSNIVDAYTVPTSSGNINIVTKTHPSNTKVTYNLFTTTGTLLSSFTNTSYNNFVLDLSGNPIYYNSNIPTTTTATMSGYELWVGTNGCVDSNSNVFTLSGNGIQGTAANSWVLTKNGTPILSINKPEYINCDGNNNIWIAYNTYYVAKVDNNGNVIWSKQVNTTDTVATNFSTRVINFLAENTASGVTYYGLVIDGKSQSLYKVDSNGNVINKTFVPGLIPGGDSSGFDYQRKYIAPKITTPSIQAKLVVQDSTLINPVPNYITLNYGTSALETGWHHFALTFDQTNTAKLYVDGKIVNQTTIVTPTSSILYTVYNYKNNPQIAIGTSNFKTGRLNEWILLPETYLFSGYIADIRFYNITLNASDIKALSKNYLSNEFDNLSWVIPTGTRGYIEEIERFFLHRLPGSKSQFYDIKIKNSTIVDPNVRSIVESNIRTAATATAPAYAQLRSIIWE